MVGLIVLWFLALIVIGVVSFFYKRWIIMGITAITLVVSFFFLVFFKPWAFVDNYELGYKFDMRSGAITVLDNPGFHAVVPIFESVHTIDTRPRQVCINVGGDGTTADSSSANRRVLNCKLVQFDKKGLNLFLEWHGRADYSGATLDDLLKIYAYDGSGKGYPFLKVLRELKAGEEFDVATPAPTVVPAAPTEG